jgi:uncharacterized membrane protein
MFEWLFKYPKSDFDAGEISFASTWPAWLFWLLIAIVAILLCVSLWQQRRQLSAGKRWLLGILQFGMLAGLIALLWQPVLGVKTLVPGENAVAVLVDNSGSMGLEHDGQSRLQKALGSVDGLLTDLQRNFSVLPGSFGEQIRWQQDFDELPPPANQSHIANTLLDVLGQARSQPLAAVVVATDGSDNSPLFGPGFGSGDGGGSQKRDFWQQLAAFDVPVHTVGVGRESIPEDLEIVDIELADKTLPGSVEEARLTVRHGAQDKVTVKVYSGDDIIALVDHTLPGTGGQSTVSIDLDANEAGLRELRFEIEAADDDPVIANNTRRKLLQVADQQRRILYFEGEPRWEYKFIRRAVTDSPGLELTTILRTTPNKFYRQGVKSADQHADGFPDNKRELYAYDALIIGNVESISLTPVQQQLIHDYVAERGGSLLMLAGKNALADGGWQNSPVATALPVELPNSSTPTFARIRAKATLTVSGINSPITQLDNDPDANLKRWAEMPELADFQRTGKLKPGATALLGVDLADGSYPLLSYQRYGKGTSYLLASSGTWRWQMQLPSEDQTHEIFWKQLMQSLGAAAVQRLQASTDKPVYLDNNRIELLATYLDDEFEPVSNANIIATLTAPDGSSKAITLKPSTTIAGSYSAETDADINGSWKLEISATDNKDTAQTTRRTTVINTGESAVQAEVIEDTDAGVAAEAVNAANAEAGTESAPETTTQTRWIYRQDGAAENFALPQNTAFLKRVASETGGSYWNTESATGVADAIREARTGIVRQQMLPLWNAPIFFLLLLGLKLLEWAMRLYWGRL